jgi:hypothetical protein
MGTPSATEILTTTVTLSDLGGRSAALSYLYSNGFSVKAPSGALVWLITGTASSFEKAFGTKLAEYSTPAGGTTMAFTVPPTIPSSVPIVALFPPGDSEAMMPTLGAHGQIPSTEIEGRSCPANYSSTLTPSNVQDAYNVTPVLNRGLKGQGETIGIVDAYDSATPAPVVAGDLANFSSCFNLSAPTLSIAYPIPGGNMNNSPSSGWGLEVALDTEWAHATAPLANLILVLSPNSAYGLYFGLDWLVATRSVDVISLSWGEPEIGLYNGFSGPCTYQCNASSDGSMATIAPVLAQADSEGMDVFVASGDCGANGGTLEFTPWYPASDPHAIGVGGTVLTLGTTGGYGSETAWNGTEQYCWFNGGGSGGGFSTLPRPSWQMGTGFDRYNNSTRGVPDVSLVAADALAIIYNGSSDYVEGTSDAAPQWAGMGALIGEARGGGPPGFLAPSFYDILNSPSYTRDFHPVVIGNNGFSAGYGWNPVTGIGTPNFSNLLSSVINQTVSVAGTGQMLIAASPMAGTTQYPWDPLPVNLSATPWNGTATPVRYQFYIGDVGVPYQESNSSTTRVPWTHVNYTRAGAYVVFAAGYGKEANATMSNPVVINVDNGGPLVVSFNATSLAVSAQQIVTFQAGVGGGTGPYRFAYFFGDGTYESSWASDGAFMTHSYSRNGSYLVTVVANDSSTPMRGGWATLCLTVGNVSGTCPVLPKVPIVSIEPENSTLIAGESTPLNVQVYFGGQPVPNAAVTLSSSQGTISPVSGTTNAAGEFTATFDSPVSLQTSQFAVWANVTVPGFAHGLGEVLMLINPVTGPSLIPVVRLAQSTIASGASDGLLLATHVAINDALVPGASVILNATLGAFYPPTGSVAMDGRFASELMVPQVSANVTGTLTVTVFDSGYTTGVATMPFTVTPTYPGVRVMVAANYTSLPSMASTGIQLSLDNVSGDHTHVSVGGVEASIESGTLSEWISPAPGFYDVEYSTPITTSNMTEAVAFNVTELSTSQFAGSGVIMFLVTWGHGPASVGFFTEPKYVLPNSTAKFVARLTSLLSGFALDGAFVEMGAAGQGGRLASQTGWTDAQGDFETNYTAGTKIDVARVWVNVTAFIYNTPGMVFSVNVSFYVPPNQPTWGNITTISILAVATLFSALAIAVAAVGVEYWRYRRPPERQKPTPAAQESAKR